MRRRVDKSISTVSQKKEEKRERERDR